MKDKLFQWNSGVSFKKQGLIPVALSFLIVFILLISNSISYAQKISKAGKLALVRGRVIVERGGKRYRARINVSLIKSDVIQTGNKSMAVILLNDGTSITIQENTRLAIKEVAPKEEKVKKSFLNLFWGKAKFVVAKIYRKVQGAVFQVKTPTAVTGVRGTIFVIQFDPQKNSTDVFVLDGKVVVENVGESVKQIVLEKGKFTSIFENRAPEEPKNINPDQIKDLEKGFKLPEENEDIIEKDIQEEGEKEIEKEKIEVPEGKEKDIEEGDIGIENPLPPVEQDPGEAQGKIKFKFK